MRTVQESIEALTDALSRPHQLQMFPDHASDEERAAAARRELGETLVRMLCASRRVRRLRVRTARRRRTWRHPSCRPPLRRASTDASGLFEWVDELASWIACEEGVLSVWHAIERDDFELDRLMPAPLLARLVPKAFVPSDVVAERFSARRLRRAIAELLRLLELGRPAPATVAQALVAAALIDALDPGRSEHPRPANPPPPAGCRRPRQTTGPPALHTRSRPRRATRRFQTIERPAARA